MKIIISTESGADLPYKIVVPNRIEIIPMHVSFGSKTYLDGEFEVDRIETFFNQKNSLPVTSAANPEDYLKHFKTILKNNPNCKIIHISYSSKLSASYQNASIAAENFSDGIVTVIDSLSGSIGLGVLVMKACEIVKQYGASVPIDEYVYLINLQREKVRCMFVPENLEYLRAGGRISGAVKTAAAVLGIKPSITIKNGTLAAGKKYRGSIYRIAGECLDDFVSQNNPSKDFIVIGYGCNVNKSLLFYLKRRAHKLGFKKSWCFQTGSTVTCHTGTVCIGFAAAT